MSQILLRVNNLNIEDGVYGKLNHFSLTLTNYDLNQYADLLEKTAQMGKGIIILFHKNGIIGRLCSEYIIMRRGRAVKKCTRNPITQEDDQAFVLGETFQKQIESIESYERNIQQQNIIIYNF